MALLVLTTAISSLFFTEPAARYVPLKAGIADAWFTVEINVTVADEVGRPIYSANVGIRDNSSSPWSTNTEGYVVITGLADNATFYTLWANKSGYLNSLDTDVYVTPNQTTNVTLVITGGMIYGIVTSPLGLIQDAIVSVPTLGYVSNVSSTDGTYTLEGVPSGSYSVVASSIGYGPAQNSTSVAAGKNTRLDFVLYSLLGQISGFVFHASTGSPLNDTNVSVSLSNTTTTVTNGADGSYLIPNLPAGTYTVTATKDGFFTGTLTGIVVVRGNFTENVNFSLTEKPTKIFGTVKSGTYLQPNVNVSVVSTTSYNLSNVEGDYSIENLTAGTYTLSAQLEGYALALIQNVVLPVGGQVRVDIELVALPGAMVRGDVLASDSGEPLISVSVTIIGPDGKQWSKETNFKGQFEFTMLTDGNYTLQFQMTGYRPLEVSKVVVRSDVISNDTYYLEPVRQGFTGFIFGFDLAHSMMILALFVTIMILAVAVYLRIRTFQTPENAPAVYDQAEEEEAEGKEAKPSGPERDDVLDIKKSRKVKKGGETNPPGL